MLSLSLGYEYGVSSESDLVGCGERTDHCVPSIRELSQDVKHRLRVVRVDKLKRVVQNNDLVFSYRIDSNRP